MKKVELNDSNLIEATKRLSLSKSVQKKNLTGIKRLVSDLVLNIHANIQQWNNLNAQGLTYIKDITQKRRDKKYFLILQDLCVNLGNICNRMDNIVENLDQIKHQLTAAKILQKSTDKLFLTWPVTRFEEVAESIHEVYCKEAKLKRIILENVAHKTSESWKVLFLTAWVHQPFLHDHVKLLLDVMLLEINYKK
ncbi:cyclin-dependent kinase 2-interacting protein [Linepithema humile]|uniref:cyclin-dependent kinase 2-interacting protein n=1 Tax=Linepithema humile TaxID=83485 RepID=UPI000622FEE7|nr:PREDICTED: cyclin-dependent kinase 2-interacting protein-like [Linepithema humile]